MTVEFPTRFGTESFTWRSDRAYVPIRRAPWWNRPVNSSSTLPNQVAPTFSARLVAERVPTRSRTERAQGDSGKSLIETVLNRGELLPAYPERVTADFLRSFPSPTGMKALAEQYGPLKGSISGVEREPGTVVRESVSDWIAAVRALKEHVVLASQLMSLGRYRQVGPRKRGRPPNKSRARFEPPDLLFGFDGAPLTRESSAETFSLVLSGTQDLVLPRWLFDADPPGLNAVTVGEMCRLLAAGASVARASTVLADEPKPPEPRALADTFASHAVHLVWTRVLGAIHSHIGMPELDVDLDGLLAPSVTYGVRRSGALAHAWHGFQIFLACSDLTRLCANSCGFPASPGRNFCTREKCRKAESRSRKKAIDVAGAEGK